MCGKGDGGTNMDAASTTTPPPDAAPAPDSGSSPDRFDPMPDGATRAMDMAVATMPDMGLPRPPTPPRPRPT
jgi:hypothetical protein